MTLEELKADLRAILQEEQSLHINWERVEALCDHVLMRLNTETAPEYPYDVVYHFLDDPDVRQKSNAYADVQRQRLSTWLEADA